MEADSPLELARILDRIDGGDPHAADEILPKLYRELRALAGGFFKGERPEHTLQPTALVHEVFLKLVGSENPSWKNRAHFMALAALAMRRILASHARRRRAAKRDPGVNRVTLSGLATPTRDEQLDLIALDDVLGKLAERFPRQCRIVEMRFLGGMSVEEVAQVLGVTERTVYVDSRLAKAFLRSELEDDRVS